MRQVISLLCIVCLCSCSKEIVVATVLSQNTPTQAPISSREKKILDALDSLSQIKPKTYYSKLSVNYIDSSQDLSFKTSLKIISDSAIHAIVSYLNFPVALASISRDSVIIVNKREKCYSAQSLDYFKELLGLNLSLTNLEEVFLGRPLYYDNNRPITISPDLDYKASTTIKRSAEDKDLFINYWLNASHNKLSSVEIISPSDNTTVLINYLSWQEINGISVPYEMNLVIKAELNQLTIRILFEKAEINSPLELIFIIPEQYEMCH